MSFDSIQVHEQNILVSKYSSLCNLSCLQYIFCWQCPYVCIKSNVYVSNLITRSSCVTTTNLTDTTASIWTGVIATATYYLPLAHVGSLCVDAVKSWTTWLGHSATLINVWNREKEGRTEREIEVKKNRGRGKTQRHKDKAWETRGQLFSHAAISKQTHITQLHSRG